MKSFDYETYYKNRNNSYAEHVKETGKRKAKYLKNFLKNIHNRNIIAEVGTGPGDVLNAFDEFAVKIGIDISANSIQSHINSYFEEKINIADLNIDFEVFYKDNISRLEILEGFKKRMVYSDKNLFLIIIKPDLPLPIENKSIDCLLLCDIVEHVNNPIAFLKDAARISDSLLIKFPVERSLLVLLMSKLRGVKYGVNHPSGHLYCWNLKQIFSLLKNSNISLIEYEYEPNKYKFSEEKYFIKKIAFSFVNFLDHLFSSKYFFSRLFLGGSLYMYAKAK